MDKDGKVIWRGVCATYPEALASNLTKPCPGLVRVVFETGPLSSFLYHGLMEWGLPVVCVCARHAKGALSVQVNKSDVNDAPAQRGKLDLSLIAICIAILTFWAEPYFDYFLRCVGVCF